MNVAIPDAVSIFWIRAIAFRGDCGASSSSSSSSSSFSSSPWSVAQFGDNSLTELVTGVMPFCNWIAICGDSAPCERWTRLIPNTEVMMS